MAKKYNLGKKSDMRKFQKDLENTIKQKTEQSLMSRKYEVNCPKCKTKIMASPGKQLCPSCSSEIDLNLNFQGF